MIRQDVKLDAREVLERLNRMGAAGQRALRSALTETARAAQQQVITTLPDRFTIRTGWIAKGIRVAPARGQGDSLNAVVFAKDDFLAPQETGGPRETKGKASAVPIGARPNRMQVTRPSKFPGRLKNAFVADINGTLGVWQRFGRAKNTTKGRYAGKKRQPIRLMYVLDRDVDLKPRFQMRETVRDVVRDQFAGIAIRELYREIGR